MRRSFLIVYCLVRCAAEGFGQSSFTRGEELFMLNKPAEALPFLESAAAEDPANVRAFLYLGMSYFQLERLDEAIAVYRRVLPRAGAESARIAFNLGNAYYVKEEMILAEQFYTQAIDTDGAFSSAYLNRANTRVRTGSLREALADYERYLALETRSPKRPQVEGIMAFIREEFAAEERRRIQAEAEAAAEAERKRRLLEDVSASLQSAAEESEGLSAGAEDVLDYAGEFELE